MSKTVTIIMEVPEHHLELVREYYNLFFDGDKKTEERAEFIRDELFHVYIEALHPITLDQRQTTTTEGEQL